MTRTFPKDFYETWLSEVEIVYTPLDAWDTAERILLLSWTDAVAEARRPSMSDSGALLGELVADVAEARRTADFFRHRVEVLSTGSGVAP